MFHFKGYMTLFFELDFDSPMDSPFKLSGTITDRHSYLPEVELKKCHIPFNILTFGDTSTVKH